MATPKFHLFRTPECMAGSAGRAFWDPARWRILSLLAENGPMSLAEIARQLPISTSAVSAHVKRLLQNRILEFEEYGLYNYY